MLVVLASTVQAAVVGFFREIFWIAGLVVGYLVAAWQYERLAGWFERFLKPWSAEIAGFLVIFMGVMLLAGFAGKIARWAVKEAGLNFVDRVLGAVVGLVRGCLFVAIVLVSMAAFTPSSKWLSDSSLAPYFLVVGRAAIWAAPAELRARFYQGLDLLHRQQLPGAPPAAAGPAK